MIDIDQIFLFLKYSEPRLISLNLIFLTTIYQMVDLKYNYRIAKINSKFVLLVSQLVFQHIQENNPHLFTMNTCLNIHSSCLLHTIDNIYLYDSIFALYLTVDSVYKPKYMIFYTLLTSTLYIQTKACVSIPLTCASILDVDLCTTVKDYNFNNICQLSQTTSGCENIPHTQIPCDQYYNEYSCKHQAYKCMWDGFEVGHSFYSEISESENTDGKCIDFTCQYFNNRISCGPYADVSCDWQNDECVEVTKCEDFKTISGCIKSRLQYKCAALVDGKVVDQSKRVVPDEINLQCLIEDCKHKLKMADCKFVNGVQCIWRNNACSKCSDYLTYDSCVKNQGQCYWKMNQCKNIECQLLSNPTMCNIKKEQCRWNQQKFECELNLEKADSHCYEEYSSTQSKAFKKNIIYQ
ncbi:unnamed protein product (macronuclear) [Paramecium tetraurelia]|uniref:Transmembrane protein n=1 Tax=Paramecium tetraurelia TaxID=5888 RepID=A0DE68_PARTE|nr:uncharacterized protein GSPATT00016177001 [Paramecium tetraurelia]CAK81335.1 unnamed protein product [Paramecium tetraurelia]|eukprot:XP_001448732.1 hypothetical protein (macronuclear) [Paramecium tetraurelia strain d4-2]